MLGAHLFALHPEICRTCYTANVKAKSFFPRNRRNRRSLNNTFISHNIPAEGNTIDPTLYYRSVTGEIVTILRQGLQVHNATRWRLRAFVTFERIEDDVLVDQRFEFYSEPQTLTSRHD